MWNEILLKVLDGEEDIVSPYDNAAVIQSLFVMVDIRTRMGYLWIWCSKTHKGIWISRLKIPDKVSYVKNGEIMELDVPQIHFVNPL